MDNSYSLIKNTLIFAGIALLLNVCSAYNPWAIIPRGPNMEPIHFRLKLRSIRTLLLRFHRLA